MNSSLRGQLAKWIVLPIVIVWTTVGFALYKQATDLVRETFDAELTDLAKSIATRFEMQEGRLSVDMPKAALDILTYDMSDAVYFDVAGPHGTHVAGNAPFAPAGVPTPGMKPIFYNSEINGRPVRVVAIRLPVQRGSDQFATVQVAETLSARQEIKRRILLDILAPEAIFIAIMVAIVWAGIAQVIKPLDALAVTVNRRTASDLTALPITNVPREIAPLIVAINQLLGRVGSDIELRNRFIANAAHQLRTPLAGLQTQSELALRTPEDGARSQILEKIRIGCERAARVVSQLLVLAKVEPQGGEIAKGPVVLNGLVAACVEDSLESAIHNSVEVSLEAPDDPVTIYGDSLLLRELIRNLLDNAIRYTPAGGKVNVVLSSAGATAELKVSDTGVGIPKNDQDRVFERFYRVEGAAPGGSGLGLAIVSEIATAHDAKLELSSEPGNGTQVTISFAKFL